jgi:predicted anti-sigma-YlaC factor YlaD
MALNQTREVPGACPEFEARLEDRVSGEISAADAVSLDEHLQNCAGCRAALEYVSFSSRLLRVAQPAADPGPAFAHMTMAVIRQSQRDRGDEKSIWSPFVSLAWKFAATSGVVLALLLTFDISRHRGAAGGSFVGSAEDSGLFSDANYTNNDRDDFLIVPADGNHGQR